MTLRTVLARALVALLLFPLPASAQTLLELEYDPGRDAIVATIAYQGTHPDHRFRVEWDPCREEPGGGRSTAGRLIDLDGDDLAKQDYTVRRRFALSEIGSCRPTQVTLRLGPVSHRTLSVPAAGR